MNANKARELAKKGLVTADDYEAGAMTLATYHDKIISQSRAGRTILVERGKIKSDTMAQLKLEGYKVTCRLDSESGLYWTKVTWEGEPPEKRIVVLIGVSIAILLIFCVGLLISKIM